MNTEELELLSDSKYRNYVAAVDKALKNFEYSSEWADLISALGKLNKVLQNNAKYQVVPKKLTIGKRLAQCLHPALPGGVHRKALETYEIIFKIIGPKRLAKDLFLYSSGLFPLLANAAMSVKPTLLSLYEIYYLPLGKTLKPGLQGLLTGILPGLEEGSEYYERTNTLLEKVAAAVDQSAFYSALWGSLLTSPAVRLPGITYVLAHLNRKLSMEDQLYIIGSDIELMVEAVSTSVQDSSVLVQRSTLDLILFCFPFHMSQATRPDMIRILSAALHVVLRRDMSLNRRLYAWLLGFDNNGAIIGPRSTRHSNPEEHATYYFTTFSKDLLVQAMVGILQVNVFGEESTLMQDLKPFRILISLLDKPELGPVILEDVLIEVFRTLYSQCKAELDLQMEPPFSKDHAQLSSKLRENKKTAELIKTANLLFNSFEPYYMWDYVARWFEECCRRTLHARLQTGPGDSSESSELQLTNFCLLVDFLLDIVSLPTRSMRVLCQETYIEIQTEHLPQLLLRMISALTSHLQTLHLPELTDSLRLCSKILSKVQPPLLSASTGGVMQFPSGQNNSVKEWEDKKVSSVSLENPTEVFEDGENPPSSRSSESGFTEFIQYQADRTDDIDRELSEGQGAAAIPIGSTSSETETASTVGSEETVIQPPSVIAQGMVPRSGKTAQKTAMQCCLEYVQQFLTRLINLYVIQSNAFSQALAPEHQGDLSGEQGEISNWDRDSQGDVKERNISKQKTSKEYLSAFLAACQLFLECSSFPVYIAEGNHTSDLRSERSDTDWEHVQPPLWLQTLMNACSQASDFSVQSVAISLVMDLVGLTQSVAMVTGENINSVEPAQPLSPNQGRVAVVIRPPLTPGNLRYIAEKTEFFKHVALTLWNQLGDATPQHHQKSVELFYQLHNLVPSSSICEDVISQQLTHKDKKIRMEAHAKFAVLWHLTRDLHINKSSSFARSFDRSLFIMLDSLNSLDGSTSSVGQAWLNQVLQRHDIARVLEPLLLLLLHPKTQRVSVQRVQAERYWNKAPCFPGEESDKHFMQNFSCNNVSQVQLMASKGNGEKTLTMDEMENFSLTVNPLSDRLSLLSTSSETIPMVVSDFDLPDQQIEILQRSDSGCSQSSAGDNLSYEADPENVTVQEDSQAPSAGSPDDDVQQVVFDLICKVVSGLETESASVTSQSEIEGLPPKDSDVDPGEEVTSTEDQPAQQSQSALLNNDSSQFLSVSAEGSCECMPNGISRNSSSPCISGTAQTFHDSSVASTENRSRQRSHSSIQFSFKEKLSEKVSEKETIVKESGKQPGAKPKVKLARRKDDDKKKTSNEKLKQTSVFFSDGLDLENWYSCGEGEISEIESDMGSPGSRKSPNFNIHPLYQHVLLYLQLYDSSRTLPLWMASVIPPDMLLTLLEGITAIIHYCLLDPTTQYHQLLVNVDHKHLFEARSGILSILHMIMSSVTLLWSVLHQADSSEKMTIAASASVTTINLGATKNLRQQILELLGPISMNHGVHFMAAIAFVWNERRQNKAPTRTKVIPAASEEQLLLVELVRSISVMRAETVIQTVKDVLKQPPAIAKDKKHLSLEVCMLQFFYAYIQRIPVPNLVDSWASLLILLKDSIQLSLPAPGQFLILGVLNEFIMKNPSLENKKDQRDLQDVTHKIVDAIGAIAGSSLEQTTWLRRNLEVKPSPKIMVDGTNLESDVEDMLSPAMETSNITPSVYSVHALTLLSEVLAHLLDMVFYSDEKERVIPLLVNIMHYVVPYLRNHSAHNAPSYRACVQLLSSLSGYQYTRRAWKKEAFDLFMDPSFFQMDASCVNHWRAIMDNLMTHDKTTFRDLMTRVAVAQSSSLNLFANRDVELEQRAMLLKRLAFAIFSSEIDQYQKYLPDIQERLVESLRLPQVPTLHSQVFLFFRVLLLRMSPQHLTSLWPTMITELVQVFLLMEQELTADEDISRTSGPSVAGLETTYTGGNGFSTSYNSQRWLNLYLSACKFLDLALALPSENLPQFQMYRWAFIPEASDDSGLEVRRQGIHQREFKPYVVRLAKLLRKRAKDKEEDFKTVILEGLEMASHQKNPEEDNSGRALGWEPGHLLLTVCTVRSLEQLLPFFNVLSQVFNSKVTSRCAGHSGSPVLYSTTFPNKDMKLENHKPFSSKARQKIEEMVEKDFLEGVVKT
ncbi:protein dopey-1 isoform X7 [Moschus berezovskii]|uniref:protein dopey-1 isoform X7 n=1 Tax=Moschus berezovskii TaxID=68408 RepID=UPI002444831A|nr:protein dopey-1 isoform X7 [Moschus berezovskii]